MNGNRIGLHTKPTVLFVDMNSFFASCEQQDNYLLRGRPVAVCVYTSGPRSCVIAPSIEAKQQGVRTGMKLAEAAERCPGLIPVETHPARYRAYHLKLIGVLKRFSDDVLPKSIDEAIVDLTNYQLAYKDMADTARRIKLAIRQEVGDYLRCSIGIAPNAFLAKLATDLQKPDGLVTITPDNIDAVLTPLKLTDLPGIGERMATRLARGGISTPLDLRYADPERLRTVCRSIVGWHWHLRLNFGGEVDLATTGHKSMQAIRSVSNEQRNSPDTLTELLQTLCLTLERRLMGQDFFCRKLTTYIRYWNDRCYTDELVFSTPMQDGMEFFALITQRMERYRQAHHCGPLLNGQVRQMGVGVYDFMPAEMVQYSLFEDSSRKDKLRKTLYAIKDRFGADKLIRAAELQPGTTFSDLIGFGSINDLHTGSAGFGKDDGSSCF